MMISVRFRKDLALRFLKAIESGAPFEPESKKGWKVEELLTLAGVLQFAVVSHGPVGYKDWDLSKIPVEHQEAHAETFTADVIDAINFCMGLTDLVRNDKFDEQYEPRVGVLIRHSENGPMQLRPIEGFKNLPPKTNS